MKNILNLAVVSLLSFGTLNLSAQTSEDLSKVDTTEIQKRAGVGDTAAEIELCGRFFTGTGARQDRAAARVWCGKAADKGDPTAEAVLGFLYGHGEGGAQDYALALKWYRSAADQGEVVSETNLGYLYLEGSGIPKSFEQAAFWLDKAAEKGYAPAENGLGMMYYKGVGVPKDDSQALTWLRKAVNQGDPKAEDNLAFIYLSGNGVPQDYTQALSLFRKAAAQGDSTAQNDIGLMYYRGQGVPQDYSLAAMWFRAAAEKGDSMGEADLGISFRDGKGVNKDPIEARKWLQKAVNQGNAAAGKELAAMGPLSSGKALPGVDSREPSSSKEESTAQRSLDAGDALVQQQRYKEAFSKYLDAKASGDNRIQGIAALKIALMYRQGNGVMVDNEQSAKWLNMAAGLGNQDAKDALAQLSPPVAPQPVISPQPASLSQTVTPTPSNPLADSSTREWLVGTVQSETDKTMRGGNQQHKTFSLGVTGSCVLKYVEETRETDPTGRWILVWSNNRDTSIVNLAVLKDPKIVVTSNHLAIVNTAKIVHTSMLLTYGRGSPSTDNDVEDTLAMRFPDEASANKAAGILTAAARSCTAPPSTPLSAGSQRGDNPDEVAKRQQVADKIEDLQSDIEQHEAAAQGWDENATKALDTGSCNGPGLAICQGIAQMGAAKARSNANKERNAANADRAEIAHLSGHVSVATQTLDTTIGGNLQQPNTHSSAAGIQQVASQQEAAMRAVGDRNAARAQQLPKTSQTVISTRRAPDGTELPALAHSGVSQPNSAVQQQIAVNRSAALQTLRVHRIAAAETHPTVTQPPLNPSQTGRSQITTVAGVSVGWSSVAVGPFQYLYFVISGNEPLSQEEADFLGPGDYGDGAWGAAVSANALNASQSALNQCRSRSQSPFNCAGEGPYQICRNDGVSRWVALAVGNDGNWFDWAQGLGIGYPTEATANNAAMANCNSQLCQVVWTQYVDCSGNGVLAIGGGPGVIFGNANNAGSANQSQNAPGASGRPTPTNEMPKSNCPAGMTCAGVAQ
jgi:TPR repeat protein